MAKAYRAVSAVDARDVPLPKDWLDLDEKSAKPTVGGFWFAGGAPTILKFFGEALIEVVPALENRPFGVNAKFFNSLGQKTLEIEHNVWVGPKTGWDFYLSGRRIFIKDDEHLNSLVLRVEPPGNLIVEKMDMRIGDYQFLANEKRHAIGHYDSEGKDPIWYYCAALPKALYQGATVFEIEQSSQLKARLRSLLDERKLMEAKALVMSEFRGIGSIQHGIMFVRIAASTFIVLHAVAIRFRKLGWRFSRSLTTSDTSYQEVVILRPMMWQSRQKRRLRRCKLEKVYRFFWIGQLLPILTCLGPDELGQIVSNTQLEVDKARHI